MELSLAFVNKCQTRVHVSLIKNEDTKKNLRLHSVYLWNLRIIFRGQYILHLWSEGVNKRRGHLFIHLCKCDVIYQKQVSNCNTGLKKISCHLSKNALVGAGSRNTQLALARRNEFFDVTSSPEVGKAPDVCSGLWLSLFGIPLP